MAEIRNLERCKFILLDEDAHLGRLESGNARIVKVKDKMYCVYPSIGRIRDKSELAEALYALHLGVRSHDYELYDRLSRIKQALVQDVIKNAGDIATWDEFLKRRSGLGTSSTNGELLKEFIDMRIRRFY